MSKRVGCDKAEPKPGSYRSKSDKVGGFRNDPKPGGYPEKIMDPKPGV